MFWHPGLKLFLMVDVDGLKIAGPKGNIAKGWDLIRKGLLLEEPTEMGNCLGCNHLITDKSKDGRTYRRCIWEMEKFLDMAVVAYEELAQKAGDRTALRKRRLSAFL